MRFLSESPTNAAPVSPAPDWFPKVASGIGGSPRCDLIEQRDLPGRGRFNKLVAGCPTCGGQVFLYTQPDGSGSLPSQCDRCRFRTAVRETSDSQGTAVVVPSSSPVATEVEEHKAHFPALHAALERSGLMPKVEPGPGPQVPWSLCHISLQRGNIAFDLPPYRDRFAAGDFGLVGTAAPDDATRFLAALGSEAQRNGLAMEAGSGLLIGRYPLDARDRARAAAAGLGAGQIDRIIIEALGLLLPGPRPAELLIRVKTTL